MPGPSPLPASETAYSGSRPSCINAALRSIGRGIISRCPEGIEAEPRRDAKPARRAERACDVDRLNPFGRPPAGPRRQESRDGEQYAPTPALRQRLPQTPMHPILHEAGARWISRWQCSTRFSAVICQPAPPRQPAGPRRRSARRVADRAFPTWPARPRLRRSLQRPARSRPARPVRPAHRPA